MFKFKHSKGDGSLSGSFLVSVLLLFGVLVSPRPALAGKSPLHVAAAADLMPVLPHLSRAFTKKSGIPVKISWGATGEEALAIRHRAPYDLFLAADSVHPRELARTGYLERKSLKTYAKGILVLWVSKKILSEGKTLPDTAVLSRPEIKKFALANPRLAPYGKAALSCLRSKGLWSKLRKKAVYGNSLAQVAQYLRTGTAQAGFLSESQAMAQAGGSVKGDFVALSPACHPYLTQAMGIVSRSKRKREARAFEDFLVSPEAQGYLKEHGYH
ncbi:MAG: molybdate ABC transporter substrate-binding protein [Nitrospiraceae bacterium]|nr:molybdate ABC transporter substrate-binding protein [Nitrospiraceae bacterium]